MKIQKRKKVRCWKVKDNGEGHWLLKMSVETYIVKR